MTQGRTVVDANQYPMCLESPTLFLSQFPNSTHPAGLEPATLGSEDRCSVQLSYGCSKNKLTSEVARRRDYPRKDERIQRRRFRRRGPGAEASSRRGGGGRRVAAGGRLGVWR